MNLTLQHCWTSTQLAKHIKDTLGKRRQGGRKPAVPKSAAALIDQQLHFVEDFENRNVRVWKDPTYSLTAQVARIEPTDYTEDLAKKLGILAHQMRQLATEAAMRAEEAERKYNEIQRVLDVGAVKVSTDNDWEDLEDSTTRKLRDNSPIDKSLINSV